MFKRKILLPTTPEAFDKLVDQIVDKYKLKDRNHAAAVIGVAIRHLPPAQAKVTHEYLGHYVIKNIANYVAQLKSNGIRHTAEVDQLVALIKKDPNDMQARDGLQKAIDEGSEYAKKVMEKLEVVAAPFSN